MSDGEKTREAIAARPARLAQVSTDRRLLSVRVLHTRGGTSFHAAQTGGERRTAEQSSEAVAALEALGAPVSLVPTRHPVVGIAPFQLPTVDLAEARSIDPDPIRRVDPRRERARSADV